MEFETKELLWAGLSINFCLGLLTLIVWHFIKKKKNKSKLIKALFYSFKIYLLSIFVTVYCLIIYNYNNRLKVVEIVSACFEIWAWFSTLQVLDVWIRYLFKK